MRQVGRCRRAVRRLLVGAGPLKRGTDRVEMASRLVVLLILLATAPVALAAGNATQHRLAAVAAQQAAERHAVRAEIIRTRPIQAGSGEPDFSGPVTADAVVRWPTPTGGTRTATQVVPVYLGVGDTVTVWLTRDGERTTEPLDPAAVQGEGLGIGLTVALVLPVTAWALHELLRWLLDRRRMRQWATGWLVVGPAWSARRR